MAPEAVFGISVLLGLVVWGSSARGTSGPRSGGDPVPTPATAAPVARLPIRGIGLSRPWGGRAGLADWVRTPRGLWDLATSILALLALAALGHRPGILLVWVFNVVGTVDLLNAFYQGNRLGVGRAPGLQGAAYFIPTVLVLLLLVTHVLVFGILLKPDATVGSHGGHRAS
jgi:hypothetical protein